MPNRGRWVRIGDRVCGDAATGSARQTRAGLLDCAAVTDETPAPDIVLDPLPGKQTGARLPRLVGLMQRLLAPDGCPWDREQTLSTLLPYLVEETYEVVDALQAGKVADHREELGDLLLQVIFQ